jgi:hypothetical protein
MARSNAETTTNAESTLAAWDASAKRGKAPVAEKAPDEQTTDEKATETATSQPAPKETEIKDTQDSEKTDSLTNVDTKVDWEKRYKDLQSHTAKQVNTKEDELKQLKAELEKLKNAPAALPKTQEDLDRFKEQHPDLYNTLFTMIKLEASEKSEELTKKFSELEERQQQYQRDVQLQKGREELMKLHPDAFALVESGAFKEWYGTLSEAKQALFNSADVQDVADGITWYKQYRDQQKKSASKPTKADEKKLAAQLPDTGTSTPPSSPEKPVWRESDIKKMTPRDFKNHEKDIDLAMKEGRFVFDISRAS